MDVVIDLETMSTKQDGVILSIGAVVTDLYGDSSELIKIFYETINQDCPDNLSRHICHETMDWWQEQRANVRDEAFSGEQSLKEVLVKFSKFIDDIECRTQEECVVWGNGATFDISMLENAYNAIKEDIPWKYYNVGDMRTIKRLYQHMYGEKEFPKNPQPHHALHDASHQTNTLSFMIRQIASGVD